MLPRSTSTAAHTVLLQPQAGHLHLAYYKPENFAFSPTYQKKLNTNSSHVITQVTFACRVWFRFGPALGPIMVCDTVSLLVGSRKNFSETKTHFPASVRIAEHSRGAQLGIAFYVSVKLNNVTLNQF